MSNRLTKNEIELLLTAAYHELLRIEDNCLLTREQLEEDPDDITSIQELKELENEWQTLDSATRKLRARLK